MKKILISLIKALFISLSLTLAVYLLFGYFLISVLFGFFLFVFLARNSLMFILNYLFRTKTFFLKRFDYLKFNNRIDQELDVINLGSSSGKYAFNYQQISDYRCLNMAIEPQTLYYDFCVLKQYSSFLKQNSTVILPLCPFSGCIKNFEDKYINGRYTTFLHPSLIHDSKGLPANRFFIFNNNPIYYIFKLAGVKKGIQIFLLSKIYSILSRCIHGHNFERDATGRMNSWLNQFSINDLSSEVSHDVADNISYNSVIIKKMEDYCLERGLRLVVVIPPVMQVLKAKFPDEFWGLYIEPLLNGLRNSTLILNYWDNEKYENQKMFKDSFLLNEYGSRIFTDDIINYINKS